MILTQEQEMIRDSMRAFAQERLAPFAAEWDKHHTFPAQALKELGELGAMGMCVPEEWDGAGMDYMSLVLTLEEIAAGDGATSTIVSVQNSLACGITQKYGTDQQKEEWLKPLARGEKLGCFCLTEPHTGSDAGAITTRADRDGDSFVLNGVKQFITTGKHAHMAIVFAVTDKAAGKKGISCFLVPTATPGFIVGRTEEKMGQHASDTVQIILENCRVPASALLGKEGEGMALAQDTLLRARIGHAAIALGRAAGALQIAAQYANQRQVFGQPVGAHQGIQWMVAEMAAQIEAARCLVYSTAQRYDAGDADVAIHASIAKLHATDLCMRIVVDCLQLLGGNGYLKAFPLERFLRDAKMNQIGEGTSEIHKTLIGRHVLRRAAALPQHPCLDMEPELWT